MMSCAGYDLSVNLVIIDENHTLTVTEKAAPRVDATINAAPSHNNEATLLGYL